MLTRRVTRRRWGSAIVLGVAALMTAGCQDTIVKYLGPENSAQIFNQLDSMRFEATELDNVHDEVRITWTNTGTGAVVLHRSFVHHGHARLSMLDAVGDTVYRFVPMEPELDNETGVGQAGDWTVILEIFGAKGRIDFSVIKK